MRGRFASLLLGSALASTTTLRSAAEPAAPEIPVATPTPTAIVTEDDRAPVVQAIADLAAWALENRVNLGAAVVDVNTGSLIAGHDEHRLLNPASNAKLLTAAVALDRLGAGYRFTTGLYGHVEGDTVETLALRSNGDPSLGVAQLYRLSATLLDLGVRHVGRILVDQSYFDDAFVPPAFEQQPNEWKPFRAPVSAVALERNTITLNVAPSQEGQPALVWFDPPGIVTKVKGAITTRRTGGASDVRFSVTPDGSRIAVELGGGVAAGARRIAYEKRVDDPRSLPGFALAAVLRKLGIDVRGDVGLGGDSVRERLTSLDSPPLPVLVRELGKSSDNFYAEMLLKALGGFTIGAPAHTKDGADAVTAWLQTNEALEPGTVIRNGSGLFDANRVSAFELAAALRGVALNPRVGPDFMAQLSVGGIDGTLSSRFQRLAKVPVVRAKTGTLDRVITLSGYVLAQLRPRADVAFSILLSDVRTGAPEARSRIDRTVEAIAAWTSRPR